MKPGDVNLPYSGWQPGQAELIARVASSEKRYVVVEAPTGVGKSAVAMGAGFLLADKTVVLVGTKQLQEQYKQQIPGVQVAMGRDNYPCDVDMRVTAANGKCVYGQQCALKNTYKCGYYGARIRAEQAPRTALNYAYWLAQTSWAHKFSDLDLLVCDEAHLLEDELRRFVTVRLSQVRCRQAGVELGGGKDRDWFHWSGVALLKVAPTYQRIMRGRFGGSDQEAAAIKSVYRAARTLEDLWTEDGWCAVKHSWGWEIKPIWVASCFLPYIDRHVKEGGKIVMMSATILDVGQFARQLGIELEDIDFIRVGSPFPVESRLMYYQPVGKVGMRNPQVIEGLIDEVDRIIEGHPEERGLVHTSSYKLAQAIFKGSANQDRMLVHDTKTRTAVLNNYRRSAGAVLVSPSMGTGVDLPYDLVRFQVIAKLPFPDLGDPQIMQRMKVGPDGLPNPKGSSWYNWQTASALIQSYGRGVRAVDDACVTYLLDGNWYWFKQACKGMLPQWFMRAVRNRGSGEGAIKHKKLVGRNA